mmetsp:Transcript_9797/g.22572  ORF Transcript_9797/g.22572 Transcript_9797/m.22572 type:complete len:289 (+) Transcript_9797:331-1197(+)
MIKNLIYFLKGHFQRSGHGLIKVILLNVAGFWALLLLKIVCVMSGHAAAYTALCRYLVLPSAWSSFCQQPWSLLTHFWIHDSFFLMLWGLWLLHTFGKVVMDRLGSRHFVVLYLLGGLAGGGLFLLLYYIVPYYRNAPTVLAGFTGSLYAVMTVAALLPSQQAMSFFFLPSLKRYHVVGFLVMLSLINLVGDEPAPGIGQLGGALLGYIYMNYHKLYTWLYFHWINFVRFHKPYRTIGKTTTPKVGAKDIDDMAIDQSGIDHILDKIASSGYESLTLEEKQQLFKAGK